MVLALSAALVALATTPLAFAVLGRLEWFKARRGRILQRPEFSSIVVGMMLVMAIPAIFAALVIKSRSFDRNRYEFDPNRTWSVLEQGREFQNLKEADAAVKLEMERLALERKNLVDNVKKLDEAMLALRSVAGTSPAVAQRFPSVLQSLAGVRKSVGVDGPQQLLDYTAPPVDLRASATGGMGIPEYDASRRCSDRPAHQQPPAPAPAAATGNGLSPAQIETELAAVPEPQRKLAAMLPFTGLPPEWTMGKSGDRHLETFNAENLYEKIDGRAESFIQYGVKGMAYAFYHPTGDPSNELQLYIFEMADSLKALGKYGSEKPEEFQAVPSAPGLHDRRQHALLRGPVLHPDRLHPGRPQVRCIRTRTGQAGGRPPEAGRCHATGSFTAEHRYNRDRHGPNGSAGWNTRGDVSTAEKPATQRTRPGQPPTPNRPAEVSPATYFALLPAQAGRATPSTSPRTSSAIASYPTCSWPITKRRDVAWQGFLRPYRDAKRPRTCSRNTSPASRKTAPRSRRSRPRGPMKWSSATISAWSTWFSARGTPWPEPTAPPTLRRPRPLPGHWPKACQPPCQPRKRK